MKKLLFLTVFILGLTANAQTAAGIRLAFGSELSLQTPILDNRIEVNLGWSKQYLSLTGVYQWVNSLQHGFNWYYGVGANIGNWSGNDGGFGLGIAGDIGAEYNFSATPFQIALDWRPVLSIIHTTKGSSGLGLSVRYRF